MRGFPLQDTGPGMNELFHDLQVEQEERRAAKKMWQCPKCKEHFYQYVIDGGHPVCGLKAKDCPAKSGCEL
jgi:hypothetical protein